MKKRYCFIIIVFIILFNTYYSFADDSCNCEDLLKRIEQLESIIYQNTEDNISINTQTAPTPTPKIGIQTINIGDKTVLDFAEFSLDSMLWTDTIKPSDTSGFYTYKGDTDDEKYLVFWGTIKNLSGDRIYIDEIKVEFQFNEKYSYSGSISQDDKTGFSNSFCSVKPLGQSRFIIYVSVPDEIMSIYEQGLLTFGFKENFNSLSYGDKLSNLPYVYNLEFSK